MTELPGAEPFRIKMVEPVRLTTRDERETRIAKAGYNLFSLDSQDVYIDLLTDSGTGAMSDSQWAGLMLGDEAYAGSRNYHNLAAAVRDVMGFPYVLPTHQGRAAEHLLFTTLVGDGQLVPNNMHFDTTKAHVEHRRATALNFVTARGLDPEAREPFKGNLDLQALARFLEEEGKGRVPLLMATLTCNSNGGQPVSLENLKGLRAIADRHGLPVFIDAARFAENAYFIKTREPGQSHRSVADIAREIFSYADGCTMSAKKDCLVNIGGFLAMRDPGLYEQAVVWGVLFEGFPTYGGLAGRDLEAMARGLREVVDDQYLHYRIGQVAYLADKLRQAGVPMVEPPGGHAVYLDARRFLSHLPSRQLPGQALAVELYLEGGVRGVEIGSVLTGRDPATGENVEPQLELVRLTIPRRTYTHRHMDYVAAAVGAVFARRGSVRGLRFTHEPPVLRHFTARFERV